MFVKINGKNYYLWRAIDHEGTVLESYVSKRRDKMAASKVLIRMISKYCKPRVIVTNKLPSYKSALKDLGATKEELAEVRQCVFTWAVGQL